MPEPTGVYAAMTHPDVAQEFAYALGLSYYTARPQCRDVTVPPGEPCDFDPAQVEAVEDWYVEYHGEGRWQPGKDVGTELTLVAVLRLRDGRYASLSAWNDYTGWGCQDGSDVRVGPSKAHVARFGLTQSERTLLGLTIDGTPADGDSGASS
jgi:hypothetical protein